ncbi:aldehyde oxidoreductase molybdenum-binding subunit PaoC [Sphingobium sp.]|uniref:aldehyde oxidoreductase molybdenum-binding subunit PaoC n=1 Tax=Sphingobium sp. TaxID=1912891 RepID=UPI002C1FFEF8|nr:aldehyde oxidoreductase molybdenum-binding subunit PaoC [Sphingobium sp.]HUD94675.1 aldehyde oxidoreductase molybdenum-binding subunit PaoC [Sphingobium sp.]
MKFDTPAGPNPIDRMRVVGQPYARIDGRLKTTGAAPYAFERHDVAKNIAYGHVVGAAISKGRVSRLNVSDALAASGVLAVVTGENAGKLGIGEFIKAPALAAPQVAHYHQAIALIVAETLEQARAAETLLRVEYERSAGSYDLAHVPATGTSRMAPDAARGDFASAFDAAPVKIDRQYTTPDQSHMMMEPHATIAAWDGDRLTCWTSVQTVDWGRRDLGQILGIPKENIRISSPYIGGGFGGKATAMSDVVLASLGARAAGRPVKVALARTLMVNNTVHRPATIQRVRIGADQEGKILAIGHETVSGNLPGHFFTEPAAIQTPSLYAGENRMVRARLGALDLPEGSSMRAPGEAPGMMALEIAMDELAEALNLDPVELRIRNDAKVHPGDGKRPFSTRQLVPALRTGAERFGWSRRRPKPSQLRDGRWLVGMGVASAIRGARTRTSGARVRLTSNGRIVVETDMTDIGTGSYTIIAQTAAEMMGVNLEQVDVRLGDSDFPVTVGSVGQRGATSSTSGVYAACVKLREAIATRLGLNESDVSYEDGAVLSGNRRIDLAQVGKDGELVGEDSVEFGDALAKLYAQEAFGAHFVEVGVDANTFEVRIRRMLAVCAAGRILNPKTARSQVIGAMTMGAGAALMEELAVDKRFGYFVNHDLASYEVPVHADIPDQQVIFLEETDGTISPMKAKGVGELGLSGVAPAIANAVYNATGIRVRDYPITLDKLIASRRA